MGVRMVLLLSIFAWAACAKKASTYELKTNSAVNVIEKSPESNL